MNFAIITAGETISLNADTENDDMDDGWDVTDMLAPLSDDADQNFDGDGSTNLKEYASGIDPGSIDPCFFRVVRNFVFSEKQSLFLFRRYANAQTCPCLVEPSSAEDNLSVGITMGLFKWQSL